MVIYKNRAWLWFLAVLAGGGMAGCGEGGGSKVTGEEEAGPERLRVSEMLLRLDESAVVLLLRPDDRAVLLPVDYCESGGIYVQLQEEPFFRPLTHALIGAVSDSLGVRVRRGTLDVDAEGGAIGKVLLQRGVEALEETTTAGYGLAVVMRTGGEIWGTSGFLAGYGVAGRGEGNVEGAARILAPGKETGRTKPVVEDWIEVRVLGIIQGFGLSVVLVDAATQTALAIVIGSCEAVAIHEHLLSEGRDPVPPYDLLRGLVEFGGAEVRRVRVTRFADNVFFGEVELAQGGKTMVVDARPSDAIALAVIAGAPVEVAGEVMGSFGEDATPYLEAFGE